MNRKHPYNPLKGIADSTKRNGAKAFSLGGKQKGCFYVKNEKQNG